MLNFKTQSQLIEAAASVMRWYTLAAINASAASASRGFAFWTEVLQSGNGRWAPGKSGPQGLGPMASPWWVAAGAPWWTRPAGWGPWGRARHPLSAAGKAPGPARPAAPSGVATYRSAGGHAVAQVIMGKANGHAYDRSRPVDRG
jgi:hypothetical protein